VVIVLVVAADCGREHTMMMQPTPLPGVGFGVTITGVLPASITSGSAPQMITVAGTNFQNGLKLLISFGSGTTLTVTTVDAISVTSASFQASVTFAAAGAYSLIATNPDSTSSGPFMVAVK
jgi:hypothetical protein